MKPKRPALPLTLWLELEDDVQRHREAIARNFAQARERLLPQVPDARAAEMAREMLRAVGVAP